MTDSTLTAIASSFLVIVGFIQILVLISQKRQTRIALIANYRELWSNYKSDWGNIIFIGRKADEYYQVVDSRRLNELKIELGKYSNSYPTIWARESVQKVFGLLGEVSTRVLQGHLLVTDIYPIFGTEFLRHSRPLRKLLDNEYISDNFYDQENENHTLVRKEIQDWLIYHDGLRRRCLILIDLLWAEASRLEDLPPDEMKIAAEAKVKTGKKNRKRVLIEVFRLNGIQKIGLALKLYLFLKRSEFYSIINWNGISKKRLSYLEFNWKNRLLQENRASKKSIFITVEKCKNV